MKVGAAIAGPEAVLAAAAPIVAGAAAIIASLKPGSQMSKDMNALAAGSMALAGGQGFDAAAQAAAAGFAPDPTGQGVLPPGSQFNGHQVSAGFEFSLQNPLVLGAAALGIILLINK